MTESEGRLQGPGFEKGTGCGAVREVRRTEGRSSVQVARGEADRMKNEKWRRDAGGWRPPGFEEGSPEGVGA